MSDLFLDRLAGWDPDLVRAAVAGLAAVAERLPAWRLRLESVGRELEDARCWSGPAARAAAAVVVELSGTTRAVDGSCVRSLDAFRMLAGHVREASSLAGEALVLARTAGGPLGDPGAAADPRAAALAQEALRHGALAEAAAVEADAALHGVGVVDAFPPVDFAGLVAVTGIGGPVVVPAPPAGRSPTEVGSWWAALTAAEQRSAIGHEPALVGSLDGVPAWARDRANRAVLARALESPWAGDARAVAAQLAAAEATGATVQLYGFDPVGGRVAVAIGDVDTAGAVAFLVPGIFTTVPGDLGALVTDAERVAAAARDAAPELAVAAVAWLGYRTPRTPYEIVTRMDARRGGRDLDHELEGLAAARDADGTPRPRTTVIAHSYGTVVVDEAAARPGALAADAVVLLGSPGTGSGGAAALEAPEVYDAAGLADPVVLLHYFGQEPWEPSYGAIELPVRPFTEHGDYYDPRGPTLAALGRVVAGTEASR